MVWKTYTRCIYHGTYAQYFTYCVCPFNNTLQTVLELHVLQMVFELDVLQIVFVPNFFYPRFEPKAGDINLGLSVHLLVSPFCRFLSYLHFGTIYLWTFLRFCNEISYCHFLWHVKDLFCSCQRPRQESYRWLEMVFRW